MEVKLKSIWNRHLEELLHQQNHHFNRSKPAVNPQRDALQYYWPACRSVEVVTCQSEFLDMSSCLSKPQAGENLHVIDYVNILGVWSSHGIRRYSHDSFLVGRTIQKSVVPYKRSTRVFKWDHRTSPTAPSCRVSNEGQWRLIIFGTLRAPANITALAGCHPQEANYIHMI